jgi:arylsulfatase A-like enzyme
VIFFADNGRLEARGIHWCYDSGLHVPLIIRWPKNFSPPPQIKPGAVNDQVVSVLDLTATTLALAGIPKPAGMESRLLLGKDADPPREFAFSARDRIDESVQRIRSVRSVRYRYIRNFTPEHPFTDLNRYKEKCFLVMPLMRELHAAGKLTPVQAALFAPRLPDEELYDIDRDPEETQNLAASTGPDHQRELARHRKELEQWIQDTRDQGAQLEPAEIVAPFEKEMHDWFGTPAWARK